MQGQSILTIFRSQLICRLKLNINIQCPVETRFNIFVLLVDVKSKNMFCVIYIYMNNILYYSCIIFLLDINLNI